MKEKLIKAAKLAVIAAGGAFVNAFLQSLGVANVNDILRVIGM